jgi:hypothetical protein
MNYETGYIGYVSGRTCDKCSKGKVVRRVQPENTDIPFHFGIKLHFGVLSSAKNNLEAPCADRLATVSAKWTKNATIKHLEANHDKNGYLRLPVSPQINSEAYLMTFKSPSSQP